MKVIVFGASGMIGQGVVRECVLDPGVERVLTVGRSPTDRHDAKLHQIVHPDLFDLTPIEGELADCDAGFYCVGVTSAGMAEDAYRRVTFDMTMAVARTLARVTGASMTFVYVSGAGADSTGSGRVMWARVRGQTEHALGELPFKASYVFRPAVVRPLHGITSGTGWYRALYAIAAPLFPVVNAIAPRYVTTTERIGRAMLAAARHGAPKRILENEDINRLAEGSG